MAKPFVSLDGVDPQGVRAEVWVQTGTGTVKELSENGKNVLVRMQVEGLKHPVQGWTSTQEAIYPILVEAKEQGREVSYRIESQRKMGVDRRTPIGELRKTQEIANENTRSLFVGVDGTLSSEAVTDPSEDPYAGGRIPATDPRNKSNSAPPVAGGGFSVEQALTGLANARKGGLPQSIVDAAAALALASGASVEQVLTVGVDEQAADAPRPVQRAMAKEAAPYVAYNTDGRVNLGSYMVQAAVGAESLAADLMRANAVEVAERHNAQVASGEIDGPTIEPQPVNFTNAAALGKVLLDLADQVQVGAYGGGRPDRMATSHSRARGFVYDAVKNRFPVPFGQSAEAQEEWKAKVVEEGIARFAFAAKIATEVAQPAPLRSSADAQGDAPSEVTERHEENSDTQDPAPNSEGAEVRQISSAAQERQRVLVEGDEGFIAPDAEVVQRFGALALAAGFQGTPDSPVSVYLSHKFGVPTARKVHAENLKTLVEWYEGQGEAGSAKFRQHVLAEASSAESA